MVSFVYLSVASGESNWVKYPRGVFAALIFVGVAYNVALRIILFPARETGLVTVKQTRSLNLTQDFASDTTVWNIVLVSILHLIGNNMLTT